MCRVLYFVLSSVFYVLYGIYCMYGNVGIVVGIVFCIVLYCTVSRSFSFIGVVSVVLYCMC